MTNIAIIPARGGSKRISKKNIKHFHGRPIIAYSIEIAQNSGLFNDILVSTDDDEIDRTARKFGASVLTRSDENANDFATLSDVIEEVLTKLKVAGKEYENFCCILPTAPLIQVDRLIEAYNLLKEDKNTSVITVASYPSPIQRSLKFEANSILSMKWPRNMFRRSQDLSKYYYDAGAFYWINSHAFIKEKKLYTKKGTGIILPDIEVQDIDNESDWIIAELKYSIKNG